MRDRLQNEANRFCAEFGLAPVRIQFAEEFTSGDVKLLNFLFAPTGHEQLRAQLAQERVEARKDILWRDLIANPGKVGAVSIVEETGISILKAAISLCEKKAIPRLSQEDLRTAQMVADRIRQLHAEGKVIKEIKNLYVRMLGDVGKLPLFEAKGADFDIFFHEVIHFVLLKNGIYTNHNPFEEGLCTYLHLRFRRNPLMRLSMYDFGGRRDYIRWSKFFFQVFAKAPNQQIGPLLKRNLRSYLAEFVRQ